MKLYTIQRTQIIEASLSEVWKFFSDPHNLVRLTPPWLNLIVPPDMPHHIHSGMIITYRVRPFAGIPLNWVSEITQVGAGKLFVDEQRFGPYKFWHHQHHFEATDAGIEVRDLVHYSLPFDPFGRLVHAVLVRDRLNAIFDYRVAAIHTTFSSKF